MRRPHRLRPGDRVVLVAPSGPVPEEQLRRGTARLESWGLRVDWAEHVLDRGPFPYLAGADADRAADLQQALLDDTVAGVICARGGYGASRIVDQLDWAALERIEPKVFVGFSDITVLHEAIAGRLGWVSVHGPMPATDVLAGPTGVDAAADTAADSAWEALRALLFQPETQLRFTGPTARALVPGRASGRIVGGCLAVLADSIGTPTAPTTTLRTAPDRIVLLEDVGEDLYALDRTLTRLRRSGALRGATGFALGSWRGCGDLADIERLVLDRLSDLGVPILSDLGFGHGPRPISLPLGVWAELDADAGTLTLTEPALS